MYDWRCFAYVFVIFYWMKTKHSDNMIGDVLKMFIPMILLFLQGLVFGQNYIFFLERKTNTLTWTSSQTLHNNHGFTINKQLNELMAGPVMNS